MGRLLNINTLAAMSLAMGLLASVGCDEVSEGGVIGGEERPPEAPMDPACVDQDGDGHYAGCVEGTDCHDGDATIHPGQSEVCDDALDNDCQGGPDDGCGCGVEGDSRACYPGGAGLLGRGSCQAGQQRCEGGVWGSCEGFVLPGEDLCDGADNDCDGDVDEGVVDACGACLGAEPVVEVCDGVDNDCDGLLDEGCGCDAAMGPCYTGPANTRGLGACEDGERVCDGEFWGACEGSVEPSEEVCGDGVDNDCDGQTDEACPCVPTDEVCDGVDNDCDGVLDEDCAPCLEASATPWQIHTGEEPFCWGVDYGGHGHPDAYQHATIPAAGDAGWSPEPDNRISFDDPSSLCDPEGGNNHLCECYKGGDFTYFQTFFELPSDFIVESLIIDIRNVDDGVRITIFNDQYPEGIVDEGSYAVFPSGSTSDLARFLSVGSNRIVITHLDDCCRVRRIEDVVVELNGREIEACL